VTAPPPTPVADGEGPVAVPVVDAVPAGLADLVAQAAAAGRAVEVVLAPAPGLDPARAAGREIGVATVALRSGAAAVTGVAPHRLARVAAVVEELRAAGGRR
jgi:hypothetical protein